jgi:Elongation complex protein 6
MDLCVDILKWNKEKLPSGTLTLIRDSVDADGSWILHSILSLYLKSSNACAALACLAQTPFHYASVARKMAYNQVEKREQGKLVIVERFAEAGQDALQPWSMRSLFARLHSICTRFDKVDKKSPFCLIVDDLHQIAQHVDDDRDVPDFVHYLSTLANEFPLCNVLCLCHGDVDDDAPLLDALSTSADLTIYVDALESGRSDAVDGRLSFRQRSKWPTLSSSSSSSSSSLPSRLQFKILDNSVQLSYTFSG